MLNRSCVFMPLSPFHYQNHQLKQRSNELLYHDFLISTVISAQIEQFRDSTGMPSLADDKEEKSTALATPLSADKSQKEKKGNHSGFFSTFQQRTQSQTRNHRRPVRLCVRPAGTPWHISEYQFCARDRDRPS